MDRDILRLVKGGKREEIKTFLDSKTTQDVTECITSFILKGASDPVPLVQCIVTASQSEEEQSIERCSEVYSSVIKLLQKNEINSKTAFSIVSTLLTNLEYLQPKCLSDLANSFVASVKNGSYNGGKVAELLPSILSLINDCEKLPHGEGDIKGTELKGHIINSLCSSRWAPSVTLHMAALFHDVPLTLEELKFVLEKILRLFGELDLADQPAVTFQLLLLSAKGHKRLVLEGIMKHFTAEDEKNRGRSITIDSEDLMSETTCLTTLRQIEGTVILHIMQAVKQNQELGSELIKYVKILQQSDPAKVISAFNLSLLLSISQLHQFEEQIFEFVKSSIMRCLRDEDRQHQSLWIRECFTVGPKADDLVLEAVEHSTFDWDHVVQGLVKLGFSLMDSFGPKLVFGAMPESVTTCNLTPTQRACQLGQRILLKTFKAHEVVRSEILDQVFTHIVMKPTAPVSHYLDLLSDTVFSAPQLLLESSNKIQEVFVKLVHLSLQSAQGLIQAIQPLLKLRPLLKDTLILVLRKAMFSRQLTARKIGAVGFLMILKNFRVLGGLPSSQVSQPIALSQVVDVHSQYNASSNEALCLEILGNLRRCFTQQADVRLGIYQGLYDVLHKNSQLQAPVLDMLLAQLKKYYEPNEKMCPPVRLEPCILTQGEQVYLVEPLGHLLKCVQQCARKAVHILAQSRHAGDDDSMDEDNDEDGGKQSLVQLQKILSSLTTRIIDAEMEDFELDKSADFSCTNGVGVKNNIYAILLLGMYEVLMEYACETGNFSAESCDNTVKLFSNLTKLSAVVKEKSAGGGKKGRSTTAPKVSNSLLSLDCVSNLLSAVVEDQTPDHAEGLTKLRDCKEFLPYLVSVALQKLGQVSSKGVCDGETQDKEKVLRKCCILGRLFYIHYTENQVAGGDDQREKRLTTQCLEALEVVIGIASSRGAPELLMALTYLEKEDVENKEHLVPAAARAEKIHKHVKKFQRLISTIFEENTENQNWKEASALLSILDHLTAHLPHHGPEFQQVYQWTLKVATDQNIEDASTCRQLVGSLLKYSKQTKNLPQLLRNVCQDIHSQMGDIDQDCTIDDSTHYAVTKANHCPTSGLLTIALNYLEAELDDIEWVIKRHKAQMLATTSSSVEDELGATQVESMDRSVCTRLGMLVNGFIELTHSAVKTKPCSQSLLKALTKLYNALSSLTKHYISLYSNKAGHLGSRFEKLVTLVGKQLTQPTYSMIIFVQMSENEPQETERKDKGKKKASTSAQAGMAKAMKQMKTIPNLIFAIEQLEKFLIQLSKKSKVDLMENFKQSTSRDFRIRSETVNTAVEQAVSSDSEDGDNGSDDEEGENNDEADSDGSDNDQENVRPENEQEDDEDDPPAKKKSKR
ncbi:Fanconi anemia group I protein [Aplysia californica]|uniref:Fanconi anemia group I protein n=1 Tax=Aplysia californica TaxID=6500 RepID=A0ABM0JPL1_APLCA|nr:Fanconi anemia group I protein [Aplysia californica]